MGRRLGEATALQPFGEQAQAVTGGPEQFDLTAVTTAEDKDVTGHRVIFECSLDFAPVPLKPLRMSVIPATSQIFVPVGNGFITNDLRAS